MGEVSLNPYLQVAKLPMAKIKIQQLKICNRLFILKFIIVN
jgi:hypothetical protein